MLYLVCYISLMLIFNTQHSKGAALTQSLIQNWAVYLYWNMVFLSTQSESTPFKLSAVTTGDHMVDTRHDGGLQSSLLQYWKHLRRKCKNKNKNKKNNWMLHPPNFLLFIITACCVSRAGLEIPLQSFLFSANLSSPEWLKMLVLS